MARYTHQLDIQIDEIAFARVKGDSGRMIDVGGYGAAVVTVEFETLDYWRLSAISMIGTEIIKPAVLREDFTLAEASVRRDHLSRLLVGSPLFAVFHTAITEHHADEISAAIEGWFVDQAEVDLGDAIDLRRDERLTDPALAAE